MHGPHAWTSFSSRYILHTSIGLYGMVCACNLWMIQARTLLAALRTVHIVPSVAHLLCRLTISAGVGLLIAVSAILSRLTRIEHGPSVACVCVCVCVCGGRGI